MGKYPAWKRRQVQGQWRSFLVIFLTFLLILAVVNGLFKSVSLQKHLASLKWDDKGSFLIALDSSPPAILAFRKEPKKAAFLAVDENIHVLDEEAESRLISLSEIIKSGDSDKFTKSMSKAFGVKVENYFDLSGEKKLDQEQAISYFTRIASIGTLFKIIAGKMDGEFAGTNVSRLDLIRLWWQLKDVSIKSVDYKDLRTFNQEILTSDDRKVLGADTDLLNRYISEYVENFQVRKEDLAVEIVDAGGEVEAGNLAYKFVSSYGAKIASTATSKEIEHETVILAPKSSYTADYLAKVFDCDIKQAQTYGDSVNIQVILGSDFAQKYF